MVPSIKHHRESNEYLHSWTYKKKYFKQRCIYLFICQLKDCTLDLREILNVKFFKQDICSEKKKVSLIFTDSESTDSKLYYPR